MKGISETANHYNDLLNKQYSIHLHLHPLLYMLFTKDVLIFSKKSAFHLLLEKTIICF